MTTTQAPAESGDKGPVKGGLAEHPSTDATGVRFVVVDPTSDIAEFLSSRRARITPEQAGLPTYGKRRVPGLRREEVASLAGVSIDYYKRLERGNLSGVSDQVLEALARALQLDDAERTHLFNLARAAGPTPPRARRSPTKLPVRAVVQRILDSMDTPAIVRNTRSDYVAANQLGSSLYAPLFDSREQPANSARFLFLVSMEAWGWSSCVVSVAG